jgi:hypothetical protein
MIFSEDESPGTPPPDAPASGDKRPKLTVVK